mmetsp:Transcript_32883/g.97967  ORF Transcript_32883/g.97967 Transcript_32883/m.97967 type:complete len:216 (-) Transcript_32883:1217-1864(-)
MQPRWRKMMSSWNALPSTCMDPSKRRSRGHDFGLPSMSTTLSTEAGAPVGQPSLGRTTALTMAAAVRRREKGMQVRTAVSAAGRTSRASTAETLMSMRNLRRAAAPMTAKAMTTMTTETIAKTMAKTMAKAMANAAATTTPARCSGGSLPQRTRRHPTSCRGWSRSTGSCRRRRRRRSRLSVHEETRNAPRGARWLTSSTSTIARSRHASCCRRR